MANLNDERENLCVICGYEDNLGGIIKHHLPSKSVSSVTNIVKLCANCHIELHKYYRRRFDRKNMDVHDYFKGFEEFKKIKRMRYRLFTE
jgi:hypothetical protein